MHCHNTEQITINNHLHFLYRNIFLAQMIDILYQNYSQVIILSDIPPPPFLIKKNFIYKIK